MGAFLLFCWLQPFVVEAQQSYPWYDQSRELTGEGFSYQCDNPYGGLVELYRTTNIHVNEKPKYRMGVPIPYVGFDDSPIVAYNPPGSTYTA